MPTVKLKIPYRSQWDEDAKNHESDCGPTCVAMLLNGQNIDVTPDGVYQFIGPKGRRQFTTFTDLRNAALGGGNLTLTYKQYRNETDALQQLRNSINQGQSFIALVKYEPWRSFTGNQFSSGHFVNVVGYSNDHVFIHDPLFGLWAQRDKGNYYRITNRRFMKGWGGFAITENPNFSCLVTDKTYEFQRKPRIDPIEPVEMPQIDDDLRRRIYSLAAYEGKLTPDLKDAETAVFWANHVGNWAKETTLHIVKSGDTYSQLAIKHYEDPALWRAIQKYNRLANTFLFIGQRLLIPLPGADMSEDEIGPNVPAEEQPEGVVPLPGHGGPEANSSVVRTQNRHPL
ncbi:MAG: LysM peptidoglycan-binding domain-containing protein [Chloroflexi bacterium]|nr:LysM peptidoglycan-binding domain-containing protein [Chloroflexota bacterium]